MKDLAVGSFVLFCPLETKSHCIAQVGLELLNLLSASGVLVCWAQNHAKKIVVSLECSQYLQQAQTLAADCSFNSRKSDLHRYLYSCAPLHTHNLKKKKIGQEVPHQQVALSLLKTCWMAPALFPKRMLVALSLQKRPRGTS